MIDRLADHSAPLEDGKSESVGSSKGRQSSAICEISQAKRGLLAVKAGPHRARAISAERRIARQAAARAEGSDPEEDLIDQLFNSEQRNGWREPFCFWRTSGNEATVEPIVGKFHQETLTEVPTRSRVESFGLNKFRKLGYIK